jgi:hypothetical protein
MAKAKQKQPAKPAVSKKRVWLIRLTVTVLVVLLYLGIRMAAGKAMGTDWPSWQSVLLWTLGVVVAGGLIYALVTKPNFRKKCAENWKPIVSGLVPVAAIVAFLWFGKTMADDFKESRKQDRLERYHAAAARKDFCSENPQALRCFPLDTVFVKTATSSSQARIVVPPGYSAEWVYDTLKVEWPKETMGSINKSVYFRVKPGVDSASIEFHLWRTS